MLKKGQDEPNVIAYHENAASWKQDLLRFESQKLGNVIKDIERHFSCQIELKNQHLLDCHFTSEFNQPKLDEVLETLATAFQIEVEQKSASRFVLKGGSCS